MPDGEVHIADRTFSPDVMLILSDLPTIAVFPVLVGPLQTLLALLPAILVGIGSTVFAVFKPGGFVKLLRFCWRQKLFLGVVTSLVMAWQYGLPSRLLGGYSSTVIDGNPQTGTNSKTIRIGPTTPGLVWSNVRDKSILSTTAVVGDHILYSTATGIGPFSPTGRGAIVCVNAHTGQEIWRYAPDDYRATFSSPVVAGNSVVCGEGLHQVDDARITCVDLRTGQRRWEFRTSSHVESTAAIADGRVFVGAGSDGFYCLSIDPDAQGHANVLWHLPASEFPDCESSPVVSDGVVYFGLGVGGNAVCAVQASTGTLLWKVATPYPVFAPPSIANGKLLVATGNGNYVQSAADLLEMKLQLLRDDDATAVQLAEARERFKPVGEIWCLDLATRAIDWKFKTDDAILGQIVAATEGPSDEIESLYFGSRDGHLYRISAAGQLLTKRDFREPVITSPAVAGKHVYCSTASGRLYCLDRTSLKPVWDTSLGAGTIFSSSPTIAHGHVYIGTMEQGLRCVGRSGEPTPPLWTKGEVGGNADDVPVPVGMNVRWQFPETNESPFLVTAPLMPLDGAIYLVGMRDGRAELVKLNADTTAPTERVAWSRPLEGRVEVAPVGCGHRIAILEELKPPYRTLRCLSIVDGSLLWSALTRQERLPRLPSSPLPGLTATSQQVILWTIGNGLGSFAWSDGQAVWDHSTGDLSAHPLASRREIGMGVPAISDNLLFSLSATENRSGGKGDSDLKTAKLSAWDLPTGLPLWQVDLGKMPAGSPMVEGHHVAIPFESETAFRRIVDGALERRMPKPDDSIPVELDAAIYGKPMTPAVSLRGQVFVATDRGKVVCLGAEP